MSTKRQDFWLDAWYQGRWWLYLFSPLAWLFRTLAARRRQRQQAQTQQLAPLGAPVIVVGNITLGGTGKTPLLIAMAKYLQQLGYRPGIISRGYGGQAPHYPYKLSSSSQADQVGDEPLLIYRETGCPVVVGPDRLADAEALLAADDCNVILSDDGLQHYRLPRSIEIAVVDGQRGLGNGLCLPAGPLREPPQRLMEVDLVVVNGKPSIEGLLPAGTRFHTMELIPGCWRTVADQREQSLQQLPCETDVWAVAGIGNPQRFFDTLSRLGLDPKPRAFADHYQYQPADFAFAHSQPLLMTAKDAVKCQSFAQANWWYLSVEATLGETFWKQLSEKLQSCV